MSGGVPEKGRSHKLWTLPLGYNVCVLSVLDRPHCHVLDDASVCPAVVIILRHHVGDVQASRWVDGYSVGKLDGDESLAYPQGRPEDVGMRETSRWCASQCQRMTKLGSMCSYGYVRE